MHNELRMAKLAENRADTKRISVLLADDHTLVRQGLRALLEAEGDIEVVAEAANGRQAVRLAKKTLPQVILMDLAMPVGMRDFKRDKYYKTLKPEVSKRYSDQHAVFLMLRNRHYGPWEESEQLPESLLAEIGREQFGQT